MEAKNYFAILTRHWRSAAVVALLIIILGAIGSSLVSPKYQAAATLRMVTPSSGGSNYQTTFADRLITTYAEIATSPQLLNELKEKLGVKALPDISVNIIPKSEILQIVVVSRDPAFAAKTANTLAEILVTYRDSAVTSSDAKELNLLGERQVELQAKITEYQQEHDRLVQAYSQTAADLQVLDRTIKLREEAYQNLMTQFQLTLVDAASTVNISEAMQDARFAEMERIGKELDGLNQQARELSIKSNQYLQQIALLRLSIQSTQGQYSNLQDRYDAALVANLRQENAQNMITVSPAFEPSRPSSPGGSFVFGLALILGVITGIVVAFLLDYFDTRVYSPEQVRLAASAPVLGSISKVHDRQKGDGLHTLDPTSQRDYWILRAQLQPMIQEGSVKTILVTSPGGAEGKSTVIYRLATVMAQNSLKVLVVDADFRSPAQNRLFNVSAEHGLYEFLMGEQVDLKQLILKDVKPGIDLLPSLTECENPIALLESPKLRTLFNSIQDYDVVLIDTPALLDFPDALALADHVHSVIAVIRWGHTTSESIQVTCAQLESIGAKILGIVINQAQVRKNSESLASDVKRAFLQMKKAFSGSSKSRGVPKPSGR